jgi:hypothetical protein
MIQPRQIMHFDEFITYAILALYSDLCVFAPTVLGLVSLVVSGLLILAYLLEAFLVGVAL